MTGVIWVVQVLHYPTYRFISEDKFIEFQAFHQKWITVIVAPMMLLELGSAMILIWIIPSKWTWINLTTIGLIWLSTFLLSVPQHARLSIKRDPATIERLIRTNWPRTLLWTIRCVFLAVVLLEFYS
jgi:hypothetical protein